MNTFNKRNNKWKSVTTLLGLMVSFGILFTACNKEDDVNKADESSALVDGQAFTIVNPSSSTTGPGITLNFPTEDGKYITITTSGKTSGEYAIGGSANNRTNSDSQAWGYYFNGTATYSGASGTITITVSGNSISGTYQFTATDQNGNSVEITKGLFAGLTLQEISGPGTFTINGESVGATLLCASVGSYNYIYGYNYNASTQRTRGFYIYYITNRTGDIFLELYNFANPDYSLIAGGEWAAMFYFDQSSEGSKSYYSNGGAISISRNSAGLASIQIGALSMTEYADGLQATGNTITAGCNLACE